MIKNLYIVAHTKSHVFRSIEKINNKKINFKKIFTIYPFFKLTEYKIEKKKISSIRILGLLIFIFKKLRINYSKILFSNSFDFLTSLKIKKIDSALLIGLSGYSLLCIKKAKKLGYKTFIDRACPHINEQKKIVFEEIERLPFKDKYLLKREMFDEKIVDKMLLEYEVADKIIVPSQFSYNSFFKNNLGNKTILSPLLPEKFFIPTQVSNNNLHIKNNDDDFIVFAIGFNFIRKGFYYLIKAIDELNNDKIKLILRTSIPKQLSLKLGKNIQIIDSHVNNVELQSLYSRADLIALPSVDEGFGMSVMEGISLGKNFLITENVGMKDFVKKYLPDFNENIIQIRDIEKIKSKIYEFSKKKLIPEQREKILDAYRKYTMNECNYLYNNLDD